VTRLLAKIDSVRRIALCSSPVGRVDTSSAIFSIDGCAKRADQGVASKSCLIQAVDMLSGSRISGIARRSDQPMNVSTDSP